MRALAAVMVAVFLSFSAPVHAGGSVEFFGFSIRIGSNDYDGHSSGHEYRYRTQYHGGNRHSHVRVYPNGVYRHGQNGGHLHEGYGGPGTCYEECFDHGRDYGSGGVRVNVESY